VLAGIAGTLDELVGLAVLIPAAIGMRGAIFGAMGSRLSTSIQTGLFRFDLRRGVLAENFQAAVVLSLVSGVFLAFLARAACEILNVRTELSVFDYVVISTVAASSPGRSCSASPSSSPASPSPGVGTWTTSRRPC
jgi:mgtE-like transporter